jgi:16S rRNA (uracil1498-N3)-methyltransferase
MHRFYQPDIASTLSLGDEESQHCVRVLRLSAGDTIEVVDGCGTLHTCRITLAHSKHCQVEIVDSQSLPRPWQGTITLAVAPTKNLDRIEWLAEKCTEMGIDRIVPLLCGNSERKVLKTERLRKILVAAMKQSLKATLPQLDELTPIAAFLSQAPAGQRFIAYCDPALPREQRRSMAQLYEPGADVTILIGPEGDFTPAEVDAALAAGFVPVTLGESRLRTETAAVAAVAAFHAITSRG